MERNLDTFRHILFGCSKPNNTYGKNPEPRGSLGKTIKCIKLKEKGIKKYIVVVYSKYKDDNSNLLKLPNL